MYSKQLPIVQEELLKVRQKLQESQEYVKNAKIGPIRIKKNKFGTEYYYMAFRDTSQNGACTNEYIGRVDEVSDRDLEYYKNELEKYRSTKKRIKFYKKVIELLELEESLLQEAQGNNSPILLEEEVYAMTRALLAARDV